MPNLCIIPSFALYLHAIGKLTPTDIIVLCAIGEHTDRNGEGCWASARTLSEKGGIGRSTFFGCADRLITHGLVERESGKDEGRSSTYRIILDNRRVSSQRDTPHPASEIGESSATDSTTINAPLNATPTELIYNNVPLFSYHYFTDWAALRKRIEAQDGYADSWLAEMSMAAQGEHGYAKLTLDQLGGAVRAFAGNGADVSFRLFKAYLKDAGKPARQSPEQQPPSPSGKGFYDARTLALLTATGLVEKLKAAREKAMDGVRVGHLYLPANWHEKFTDAEAKVLKLAGVGNLLSDDTTTASVALSNLKAFIMGVPANG